MTVITESTPEYASLAEQLRLIEVIETKYGKIHGGSQEVRHWMTKPEFVLIELHSTVTVVESLIQADFYDKRKESTGCKYITINRETLDMKEITLEEAKSIRGWWFDDRGLIQWV